MREDACHDHGFSLLELTVALALLSVIMMLAYSGLKTVARADERTVRAVSEVRDILKVHKGLRGMLELAYPFDIRRAKKRVLYPVSGDDRTVAFTSPRKADDVMRRLKFSHDPLSLSLSLLDCPDWNDGAPEDVCKRSEFLAGVATFKISYLKQEIATTRWVDVWQRQKDLPEAIKIALTFKDSLSRDWPDMIVRTLIDEQAHCNFDPVSRQCR